MHSVSLKRARLISGVFAAVLLLVGAGDDAARIDRLGHKLMCVCGCYQILLECSHAECSYLAQMHAQLTSAVSRGVDDNGIIQSFVQAYGNTVLIAPSNTGFNRIAWIMPYLALVLGIALVVLLVWMWKSRPPSASTGIARTVRGAELDRFRSQVHRETEV
ncbi:MAG: cytochrome c-type biogenesis protein CcmH [Acidobacteria bacterium]|nr:cytochrome c-type biogenesis protein CcmH [Acidobacteriota bacterium]